MSANEDWPWLLDRAILDGRILLATGSVPAERRSALADEVRALRLARLGIRADGQAHYLRMAGIVRRSPRLTRGPREWGDAVSVRLSR